MRQIANLYRIEEKLRAARAGPALIQAYRASQSRPIFTRLYAAIAKLRPRYLPQSAMGKAMTYAENMRPALARYLEDGRIQIDNNGVENAIRPTAIGKKNFLFFGSAEAGQNGAILYTIIESCRRRGINPIDYLRDVLTRLPTMSADQIHTLTPEAWAKARRATATVVRAA